MDWKTASIWLAVGYAFWGLSHILEQFKKLNETQKEIIQAIGQLYRLIDEKDDGSYDRRVIKADLGFINDQLHKLNKQFDKGG